MRMDRILGELQHTLGADTLELAMRVGLHSGPVTAGVLRGDKGRFQLFGDTVNTGMGMLIGHLQGSCYIFVLTNITCLLHNSFSNGE